MRKEKDGQEPFLEVVLLDVLERKQMISYGDIAMEGENEGEREVRSRTVVRDVWRVDVPVQNGWDAVE